MIRFDAEFEDTDIYQPLGTWGRGLVWLAVVVTSATSGYLLGTMFCLC